MSTNDFFNESKEQSRIKAEIVSKYFWAWARVVMSQVRKQADGRIAYIDLFAGPGRYSDNTKSTPLLVLEQAINDEEMRERLVTIFNDADTNNTQSLQRAIEQLPNVGMLKYKPIVQNKEVGQEIVQMFEQVKLVPTLFFIDPFGYKGLSLRLINSVLKNWGCDCIFFFNYNRIHMGLANPFVEDHMNALFGVERANQLRSILSTLHGDEREFTVVEEIAQALKAMGGNYVLPFRFKNERGNRTSHHLIFVSKHFKGYEIMKGIMANFSSSLQEGVPSFEYNPATIRQPLLFNFYRPLEDLKELLLRDFAGQTLTMREIYERHSIDTPYIDKNYKHVLIELEAEGKIIADPPASKRRPYKGEPTFGDNVRVTFP